MREGRMRPLVLVAVFFPLALLLACGKDDSGGGGLIPTMTSISTQRGPAEGAVQGGTPVFIRGTNFGSDTVVFFGEKISPRTIVQSSSFIIAEAGPVFLSGLADVTVTTGGQIAVETDGFRYTPLLAFSSDRTGNFEIFTMSIDGFDIKQVTNNALGQGQEPLAGEINESPAFSPDGKDIVYVSNKNGDKDIFIASRTGANPTNLTQASAATDINPAFSPDGNFIVFASTLNIAGSNPGGDFEIYRMNQDGSNLTRLTANVAIDDTNPSYSPDGSRIVYASGPQNGGETDLFIMNSLDGGNKFALPSTTDVEIDPVYSPDGTQVVFSRNMNSENELWIVNADGSGNPIRFTFAEADAENPVFLPSRGDNKVRLLFQKTAEFKSEIFRLICSGSATSLITVCDPTISNDNISKHVNSDNDPAISP